MNKQIVKEYENLMVTVTKLVLLIRKLRIDNNPIENVRDIIKNRVHNLCVNTLFNSMLISEEVDDREYMNEQLLRTGNFNKKFETILDIVFENL